MDLGSIYRYFAWKSGYQIAAADIHSLVGSIGRTNGDLDLFCSFFADDKVFIFLDLAIMASSNLLPPTAMRRLNTMPPRDNTEISVVLVPISTTRVPVDLVISRFIPKASAIGFSTT